MMNWQYLFDSMLSVELKLYKFIIIIVIIAIIVIYTCIIFISFYNHHDHCLYRKISNISCTKFQNLNDSRFISQLSVPNPLKPGVKLRMKM